MRNTIRFCACLALPLLTLLSLGCGESAVADQGTVTGSVKVNGKPLKFGRVVFYTQDNIAGKADIQDGRFVLPLDTTGEVRICFVDFRLTEMQIAMANPNHSKKDIPELKDLPRGMTPEDIQKIIAQQNGGQTGPDGQPLQPGMPPMPGDPKQMEAMMQRMGPFVGATDAEKAQYLSIVKKYGPKGTGKPIIKTVEGGQELELSLEL